jgi:hypothetical protein
VTGASIEQFAKAHFDELIALVAAEGWAEYADDVERTYRALTARGVTTLVAIVDGRVAGAIQRAGGLHLDVRTGTDGYYERLGARRSLGFRLTRADLGLSPDAT